MRKSISLDNVTFEDLEEVLRAWQDGTMNFVDVQGWAEKVFEADKRAFAPQYPEDDPRSAVLEVMALLNWMYSTRVMRRDTPILLEFLSRVKQDPHAAWAYYREVGKEIDSPQRWDLSPQQWDLPFE